MNKNLYVLVLALLISSCASPKAGPDRQDTLAKALPGNTNFSDRWSATLRKGAVADGWLKSFKDQKLEKLVDEVLKNSPALAAASANVEAAAAAAKKAGASLAPAVNVGGASSQAARGDLNTETGGVALNMEWELDVWGRLGAAASAAEQSFRATEADFNYARQSLIGQTAKAWFLATDAYLQRMLAQESVDIFKQLLDIANARQKAGRIGMQDVYLARADLASAEERLRYAQGAYEQSVRSLEILLGRYPAADLETRQDFVPVPDVIPVGLPSEMLERRPDIVAAERHVAAAFQKVQTAKAAKLPRVSLTASGGQSSTELGDLLKADKSFWNIGANFLAPLDVGGGLQAQVEIETAQQKAAVAKYGQVALQAFGEVENALSNETLLAQRQVFLKTVVGENTKAYQLGRHQYDAGKIAMLNLLQMQARVVQSRIGLIHIENSRLAQRVDLHLALGGSFE